MQGRVMSAGLPTGHVPRPAYIWGRNLLQTLAYFELRSGEMP